MVFLSPVTHNGIRLKQRARRILRFLPWWTSGAAAKAPETRPVLVGFWLKNHEIRSKHLDFFIITMIFPHPRKVFQDLMMTFIKATSKMTVKTVELLVQIETGRLFASHRRIDQKVKAEESRRVGSLDRHWRFIFPVDGTVVIRSYSGGFIMIHSRLLVSYIQEMPRDDSISCPRFFEWCCCHHFFRSLSRTTSNLVPKSNSRRQLLLLGWNMLNLHRNALSWGAEHFGRFHRYGRSAFQIIWRSFALSKPSLSETPIPELGLGPMKQIMVSWHIFGLKQKNLQPEIADIINSELPMMAGRQLCTRLITGKGRALELRHPALTS